jgi:hypothetical protein
VILTSTGVQMPIHPALGAHVAAYRDGGSQSRAALCGRSAAAKMPRCSINFAAICGIT